MMFCRAVVVMNTCIRLCFQKFHQVPVSFPVQLGGHVIQEQDRRIAELFFQIPDLRHFQGQHEAPLLPL